MLGLLDLPDEILSNIFCNLSACELCKTRLVCRKFDLIGKKDDKIWRWFSLRDYKIGDEYLWTGWTFRDFYAKVLYQFAFLRGWWKRKLHPYGGLIYVKMEKDAIIAYECLPPLAASIINELKFEGLITVLNDSDYSPRTFGQLRFVRVFGIEPDDSHVNLISYSPWSSLAEGTTSRCIIGYPATVARIGEMDYNSLLAIGRTADGFEFFCNPNLGLLETYDYLLRNYFGVQARESVLGRVMQEFEFFGYEVHTKFDVLASALRKSQYTRLNIQHQLPITTTPTPECPFMKPGLYCSLYSVHGWEIFNFSYSDDGKELNLVKITGDPNVPAGQISVRVFLNKPIHLTRLDHLSFDDIIEATTSQESNTCDDIELSGSLEPFNIPVDCHLNHDHLLEALKKPTFSRWRYQCECQEAETGHVDAKFEKGLFVGFDDGNFAVLWFSFRAVYAYYRLVNTANL